MLLKWWRQLMHRDCAAGPDEWKQYTLSFPGPRHKLYFRTRREPMGRPHLDLNGCAYQLGKRSYTDIATFSKEKLEQLNDTVSIWLDEYNCKVLCLFIPLPAFDSDDRDWSSRMLEFLVYDGEKIDLVVCCRGYKIGSITIYEDLAAADEGMRSWLEMLEFPLKGIRWMKE